MNHWRFLKWLFPERAEQHSRQARRQELEIEVMKRQHTRIQDALDENNRRLEDIEAQIRVMGRGIPK